MHLQLLMPIIVRYNLEGRWDLSKTPWHKKAALWFVQTAALALALGGCYAFSANGGCGAGNRGRDAIRSNGLIDVQLGSTSWYRCPKYELFGSYFTATNVQGRKVDGFVCCGFTSCVVRW
jgi:hypothetical protein